MDLSPLDSGGSESQKRAVKIKCLGRNKKIFEEFVEEFKPKIEDDKLHMYIFNSSYWTPESLIRHRPLESIALIPEIKDRVINEIKYFDTKEDWFIKRGLAYKLTFLLHGEPGTGKTSFVRVLASYFKKNICVININSLSDDSFHTALTKAPTNSIIIIEDFDSSDASSIRYKKEIPKEPSNEIVENQNPSHLKMDLSGLSLTGILNGLDGIQSLHNVIIFLTTNYLEKVDPALYRKGRVDHIIKLDKTPAKYVKEYSEYIFPKYDFSQFQFKDTLGCELNSALLTSQNDPKIYLEYLDLIE